MKKIGIITMHKVINSGSALQAFALQKKLEQLGYDAQIIDYEFPAVPTIKKIKTALKNILKQILRKDFPDIKFTRFYEDYLNLTEHSYDALELQNHAPVYDIYMTGSDQVWNTRWTEGDTNFLLSFAPQEATRLSYASSFTSSTLDDKYREVFAKHLCRYQDLSVREQSGKAIIKDLTGKDSSVVCDPTLLLTSEDYHLIARKSTLCLKEPFILVYILDYMFDPYPEVMNIVNAVQKKSGLRVLYVTSNYVSYAYSQCLDYETVGIKSVGPSDFCWLFSHASFVITTSFHGTAFSIINQKPVLAVVQNRTAKDGRIPTLLNSVHQTASLIAYDELPTAEQLIPENVTCKEEELVNLREQSTVLLSSMLDNCSKEIKM